MALHVCTYIVLLGIAVGKGKIQNKYRQIGIGIYNLWLLMMDMEYGMNGGCAEKH
jgi:hypothetical protein